MVAGIIVSPLEVYIFLVLFLVLFGVIIFLVFKMISRGFLDTAIMLTKEGGFDKVLSVLRGKKEYIYKGGRYMLPPQTARLNKRGKALYIHSEGKAEPLDISHQKPQWLNADSIQAIINNDMIQKILTPKNPALDLLIIIGSIGGIIAGFASVVHLLIALNVI